MKISDVCFKVCSGMICQVGINQACVVAVILSSNTCELWSHSAMVNRFDKGRMHVQTPSIRVIQTVYPTPFLDFTDVSADIINFCS